MLTLYYLEDEFLRSIKKEDLDLKNNDKDFIWYDLFEPTKEEEDFVENLLGIEVLTQNEIHKIGLSNRFYQTDGAFYTTATIVSKTDTVQPEIYSISFVLKNNYLITVRYIHYYAFSAYIHHIQSEKRISLDGSEIFIGLFEATINRLTDILERSAHKIDELNHRLFRPTIHNVAERTKNTPNFEDILRLIGIHADLNSKVHESLLSITLLITAISETLAKSNIKLHHRAKSMLKDVKSLTEHTEFLSNKIYFLMDATLGMINIEQTLIIKIFSLASVIFLPPTLIASIYGMNFEIMPELNLKYGYGLAITLMIISAYVTYDFFKRRKWL